MDSSGDFFGLLSTYSKESFNPSFLRQLENALVAADPSLTEWRLKICVKFERHLDPIATFLKGSREKASHHSSKVIAAVSTFTEDVVKLCFQKGRSLGDKKSLKSTESPLQRDQINSTIDSGSGSKKKNLLGIVRQGRSRVLSDLKREADITVGPRVQPGQLPPPDNIGWAGVFYEWILLRNTVFHSLDVYCDMLKVFLSSQSPMTPSAPSERNRMAVAMSLLDYLQRNTQCPQNVLVGQIPSQQVLADQADPSLSNKRRSTKVNPPSYRQEMVEQRKNDLSKSFSSQLRDLDWGEDFQSESLLDRLKDFIVKWSAAPDSSEILEEIQEVAKKLRRKFIDPGSLVIIRLSEANKKELPFFAPFRTGIDSKLVPPFLYARVLKRTKESIIVTVDPYEESSVSSFSVSLLEVWPLPTFCDHLLLSTRNLIRLVHDPFQELYQEISRSIRSNTIEMMTKFCDVDYSFASRFQEPFSKGGDQESCNFSLKDCKMLRRVIRLIEHIMQSGDMYDQMSFYQNTISSIIRQIESIEPILKSSLLFPLSSTHLLEECRRYCDQISKLLYFDLLGVLENCDSQLHSFSEKINRIMDGSLKRELTDWWLGIIEKEVDAYLKSHQFILDAVPTDYTNRPPRSPDAVRENLRIIQELLDPSLDSKYGVSVFVKGLKDMIYVRIDAFVRDVEEVLQEELPFLREGMSGPTIHKLMREMDDSLSPSEAPSTRMAPQIPNRSRFFIHGMLKDLAYLYDMKKMDDGFGIEEGRETKGLQMTHVVPVAGLIMGRFHMIEQELNTVIELWIAHSPVIENPSTDVKKEMKKLKGEDSDKTFPDLIQLFVNSGAVKARTVGNTVIENAFPGSALVDFLVQQGQHSSRDPSIQLGQAWLEEDFFHSSQILPEFKDTEDAIFYLDPHPQSPPNEKHAAFSKATAASSPSLLEAPSTDSRQSVSLKAKQFLQNAKGKKRMTKKGDTETILKSGGESTDVLLSLDQSSPRLREDSQDEWKMSQRRRKTIRLNYQLRNQRYEDAPFSIATDSPPAAQKPPPDQELQAKARRYQKPPLPDSSSLTVTPPHKQMRDFKKKTSAPSSPPSPPSRHHRAPVVKPPQPPSKEKNVNTERASSPSQPQQQTPPNSQQKNFSPQPRRLPGIPDPRPRSPTLPNQRPWKDNQGWSAKRPLPVGQKPVPNIPLDSRNSFSDTSSLSRTASLDPAVFPTKPPASIPSGSGSMIDRRPKVDHSNLHRSPSPSNPPPSPQEDMCFTVTGGVIAVSDFVPLFDSVRLGEVCDTLTEKAKVYDTQGAIQSASIVSKVVQQATFDAEARDPELARRCVVLKTLTVSLLSTMKTALQPPIDGGVSSDVSELKIITERMKKVADQILAYERDYAQPPKV